MRTCRDMPRGLNRYDEAGVVQKRLWTPAVLRPKHWYDAFDLSTLQFQTAVSSWANKGTDEGNATQSTGANQPTYLSVDPDGTRRGYPFLSFDGTNDSLILPTPWGLNPTPQCTLICVARPFGPATTPWKNVIFGSNDGSLWNIRDNGSTTFSQFRNVSSAPRQTAPDAWGIYSITFQYVNGTADIVTSHNNGTQIATTTSAHSGGGLNAGHSPAYLCRGDGSTGTTTSLIRLAEVLAIPSFIGTQGRQNLEGYFAWKWGMINLLPATHPFINRPPLIGD